MTSPLRCADITLDIIPHTYEKGQPWGIGIGLRWGAENFAAAASAAARKMKVGADDLLFESSNAGRLGGFLKQMQDRIHQVNSFGYEIKALDAQVQTQTNKIAMAIRKLQINSSWWTTQTGSSST